MPRRFLLTLRLALQDLLHEWRLAACLIAALCAVLVPLLILFGLKEGMIHQWSERLLASPGGRELVLQRHMSLDEAWFRDIRQSPLVAFAMPDMFSASRAMDLMKENGRKVAPRNDVILSGAGDPLLGDRKPPEGLFDIVLSHAVAQALDAHEGEEIQAVITRSYAEKPERIMQDMRVVSILGADQISRQAVFVSLAFATALESYKDGRKVPLFKVGEGASDQPIFPPYPGARLYAKRLDDVLPLSEKLSADDVPTVPKEAEVRQMQQTKAVLDRLFMVIAGLGLSGMLCSLSASLWANIDRKRLDFALLTLLGMKKRDLLFFPVAQALIIVTFGCVMAFALYAASARWIDWLFRGWMQSGESATRLPAGYALLLGAVVLATGVVAAMLGGYRMMKIEPVHALRS